MVFGVRPFLLTLLRGFRIFYVSERKPFDIGEVKYAEDPSALN